MVVADIVFIYEPLPSLKINCRPQLSSQSRILSMCSDRAISLGCSSLKLWVRFKWNITIHNWFRNLRLGSIIVISFFFSKVFYGGQPWPSSLTAMTALNWRKISSNSSSCKQLQDADSRLRERLQPTSPFSLGRHHRVTSCDSQQEFTQQTQQMLDYQSATLCVL